MGISGVSMSTCYNISDCVSEFLAWHKKELTSLSSGLEIIKNCIGADAVTFSVYFSKTDDLSLYTQFPENTILASDDREAAKENFQTSASGQTSDGPRSNTKYRVSYWVKNIKETKSFQIHIWYSDASLVDKETQIFLDMACPLILQKYRDSRPFNYLPHDVTEAFSVIADGFILYDKDQNILAFNNRQTELFPSVAKTLEVGANYKYLLQKQLESGQFDIPPEDHQTWVNNRSDQLRIHGFTEEQEFDNGTTIRLTNYRTPSGGTIAVRSDISELVAERQKARENEELFRTLLVGAPIPLAIIVDEVFVYGNAYAHELFELENNELIGKKTVDLYWKSSEKPKLLDKIYDAHGLESQELEIRTANGNKKTVITTGTFINYKEQRALFLSLLDITETVKAKDALANNEKQIHEILELIPDALIVQVNGEIRYANKGAVDMFKAGHKDHLIGTASLALSSDTEIAQTLDLRNRALSGENIANVLAQKKRLDGTTFPAETHVQSVLWDEQVGTLVVVRDISLQRNHEDKLLQREREMTLAQQVGQFAHFRIRLSDQTLFWSDELYHFHGLDPKNIVIDLERAASYVEQDDQADFNQSMKDAIKHKQSRNFDIKIRLDNGSSRSLVGTVIPETNDLGDVISIFGVAQDATDQRELEEKFRQSQKMEAVGQLTGGVAHDFNNLLAIIQGNTELLMEIAAENNVDFQDRLQAIMRAAARGADLTSSMLAFSRTQRLMPSVNKLDTQMTAMINVLRRTLEENIEISFNSDADLWNCMVDLSQVENALLNLSLNARDAMKNGGHLRIETQNMILSDDTQEEQLECPPGDYVMLSVTDSGCGISPEKIDHVFEPFFTTKEVGEGTGLGLSMVYGFIKQSNGHISISSKVGTGTTVKLYLPRAKTLVMA